MHSTLAAIIVKSCIVCEQPKEKGIYVYNGFICEECERKIVQTETDDPNYSFYLRQLRKINVSEEA